MSRRGNGEGSIYRRQDGRWVAAITRPNGRQESFYARSRSAAAAKLEEEVHKQSAGIAPPTGNETLTEFLHDWLESVRPQLRPRTWVRYEQFARLQLIPKLGRRPLGDLQPQELQSLYSSLVAAGLSPSTVRKVHRLLHVALVHAVRWGLVSRNVADLVDAPREARKEMETLSETEVRQFLTEARQDRLAALWLLAITTGMRQGEMIATRWTDIDLRRGSLQVTGTLQREPGKGLVREEPKTERSRRRIVLGQETLAALHTWKSEQSDERLQAGANWFQSDLVFTRPLGQPFDPDRLRRRFRALLQDAGLPRIRFHDLRHTAATLMMSRGIHPKVASDLLGHSTVAITLDLYSHSSEPMHREAAEVLDGIVRVP